MQRRVYSFDALPMFEHNHVKMERFEPGEAGEEVDKECLRYGSGYPFVVNLHARPAERNAPHVLGPESAALRIREKLVDTWFGDLDFN